MKMIQASDLHLDSPFGSLPPGLGRIRRREQAATLERLVRLVRETDADALLLAGDVFERSTTRPETVRRTARLLGTLAPTPVLIAPGNHDPVEAQGFWSLAFPENVTVFGAGWSGVQVGPLTVWGRGFEAVTGKEDPLRDFPGEASPFVLLLHADLGPPGRQSPYAPLTLQGLRETGALWTALGHSHQPLDFRRGAYAGSLEPLGFDEEGQHGCVEVEVDPAAGRVAARRVPLACRGYVTREVDTTGLGGADVAAAFRQVVGDLDPRQTVLRLRLVGRREEESPPPAAWEAAAEAAGWPLALVDETRPAQPGEADPLTVKGRFAQAVQAALEEAGPEEARLLRQALADGNAALEGRRILDL